MADSKPNVDIDTYLRLENNSFNQDVEADRILTLYESTKNPLELLELTSSVFTTLAIDLKEVKIAYRKKSLLLHPDKCKHPRAQEAFDILKTAENALTDDAKRAVIEGFLRDARDLVYKSRSIKSTDEQAHSLEVAVAVKLQYRKIIKELETRDQIRNKNEIERKIQQEQTKIEERKRKIEHDKLWEETREERVGNWRKFMKQGPKKRKSKKSEDGM
ncbi:uncharacterized protein BJ171DRAFT_517182 [Polychytrium aggregatum]|uniref:uncharacterized protein n=1 Tax=Polychytrium aggregatum TaxID=110093 RepID=UPI0022FE9BFE|nr:uncharacterized protein BJ171DRAFT_517182 [Polychytrium aggregatum]KAI9199844.1 hypothetical protein BJ171DRAFT_517182 [Polychytrium aggregatum]